MSGAVAAAAQSRCLGAVLLREATAGVGARGGAGQSSVGVSAIAWPAALSKVPLSVAYPFNALGYLVILIASILVLHERANVMTWVGSLLVVSGLIIAVLAKPQRAARRVTQPSGPGGLFGRSSLSRFLL